VAFDFCSVRKKEIKINRTNNNNQWKEEIKKKEVRINRKKAPDISFNIIAASQHALDLINWQVTLSFHFNYSHVLPVNRYVHLNCA